MAEQRVQNWKAVKLTHYLFLYYFLLCYDADTSLMQPGLQKAHLIALCRNTFSCGTSLTQTLAHFLLSLPQVGRFITLMFDIYTTHTHTPQPHVVSVGLKHSNIAVRVNTSKLQSFIQFLACQWYELLYPGSCFKCCLPKWIMLNMSQYWNKIYSYFGWPKSIEIERWVRQVNTTVHSWNKKIRGSQTRHI